MNLTFLEESTTESPASIAWHSTSTTENAGASRDMACPITAREDASAWVSLAVVGREPRAEADVVVKDVEAWVTLLSDKF